MDLAIRERLLTAESRRDAEALESAYELIKSSSQGKSVLDSSDSLSTDLYVLCAEQALQLGYLEMSRDCLQMYFKGKFPVNQFLGRAYLCQGQLHTPLSTDNLEEFEKFVMFFMKAIDVAIHDQRYYFLIYNASVLYWQLVRPYLKPGFRYCLIPSLSQIVKALNQTGEEDSEWRAELMINLLECFLDASKLKDAKEFSSTAATFIKENVPDKYSQLFSLMVYHKLMDVSQVEKEIQHSIRFSVIYKMQTLKSQWDTNEFPSDATENLNSLYVLLKQYKVPPASVLRLKIPLILELAHFCVKVNCLKLACDCILDLKRAEITDQGKLIEIQCLESEYEIKKMDTRIMTYTKGVVEARLEVIKALGLALKRAVQLGDAGVIQVVCAAQWNLCLPLLQHNLRQCVRAPLAAVAGVLEAIDSTLVLLRCQVHMEIARIEEDGDRIEAAVEHLQKAMHLDKKGHHQEYLRLTFNRLHLCTVLHKSPERPEDRAAVLIEQAKTGGEQRDSVRKRRALLVNAGRALAPDSFHIVLDSENEVKVSSGKSGSQISYLCAKAQHHIKSIEKADEHLKYVGGENEGERVTLWAYLAKAARKGEVWDVCRTACRFCLLYEEALLRKVTKPKKILAQNKKLSATMMDDDQGELPGESVLPDKSFSFERDLLRICAEIRFINAEATINLLRLQGVELNDCAVPPECASPGSVSYLPENDPEWKTYSSWIDYLSQYAMGNFQRAAEIGEELNEAWVVHSAVVYILNYNRHLISSGRQRQIVKYLQTLLGAIQAVGHDGSAATLLMLCDALARGLMLPWIPKPEFAEKEKQDAATGRSEKAAAKKPDKANVSLPSSVDPSGLPDVKAALEICEFALSVADGAMPDEAVPVAAQQQIIATWVKAKQLNQQQISHKLGTEENKDEAQNLMAQILVGLEMHSCNGLGLMDFTLPSLSQLVKLALECSWSDSLVELQTLTRLMYFAYESHDYEIVMTCSKRILQTDEKFLHSRDARRGGMPGNTATQEMLSIAACIQGKSIMEKSSGRKHVCVSASEAFVQSARFAGRAGSYPLVMFAARHFWNTCLPWLGSPQDRGQFKEPTEIFLKNIIKAESKNKQEKRELLPLHQWITKDFQSIGLSDGCFLPGAKEDLTLTTSLYGLLFHIYADQADWETALKVLDEAIQVLPPTRHRLLIFKHRVTVKARLGCNFTMDIEKLRDESEDYLSQMWHHLVTVSSTTVGQLSCFQNAITAVQKQENEWQKVDYLLEFAQWLYCNQFPLNDVIKPLDWVVDLLLPKKFSMPSSQGEEHLKVDTGSHDAMPQMNLEDLSDIKQLEALFRAQTLMAFISGCSSPSHQQHCLMAYACILRIWQVSLSASGPIAKSSQLTAPQKVQSINAPKTKKDKKKEQQVEVVTEELKRKRSVDTLPASVEEWAHYDCPKEMRDALKEKTNSYGINWGNFPKPMCTLYFMDLLSKELQKIFCPHLILPIFQLAEVIANEVVGRRSLSDLYHLRIALICSDLKLSQASLYHEKAAGEAHISELEQAMCRHEIALKKEKQAPTETEDGKAVSADGQLSGSRDENILASSEKAFEFNAVAGKGSSALSFPYLWIEKAEVLIQLGLYQQARLLLSEAHGAAQELGALHDVSRCLYLLAVLANLERNHGQAKALLEKAQLLGGNEQFWYNSTLSLTEAILEGEEEGRQSMACEILEHTVGVLRSALEKRPNRQPELGFVIASLEARKTVIQIHSMAVNAEPCQLPHMLQESYNKLVQSEKDFFHYGHKHCSAEILLECANVHRMVAKQERSKEAKHNHYLDAYNLAQRAVSETEEVFHDVWSLFAVNETGNISIPLMRQLANRKLNLVEIVLDIFHLIITERKLKKMGEASSRELVEAFLRGTAEDDAAERAWEHMEHTVGHVALAQLANIRHLCRGCPDIKSKCLCLTGKTLHLLAIDVDPVHSELYWEPDVMEEAKSDISKSSLMVSECGEQGVTDSNLPTEQHQYDECRRKILELKKEHGLSQKYLSQSSEALLQSVCVAFSHNVTDVLASASLEMAECFQQFDPVATSQFLALHQSCSASLTMKSILLAATSNTSSSQLAALLHLQNHLQQHRNTSDLLKKVEQQLAATSMAWKNLCIPVEHFNIMDELPSNFCVMILQHSEDRSNLYSSLIEKPKVNTAEPKGRAMRLRVQAKVSRCPVSRGTFSALLEKLHLYKQQQMESHLRQAAVQNLDGCVSKTEEIPPVKTGGSGHDVTSEFSEILEMMEDYLKPVLSQCDLSGVRAQSTSVSAAESGTTKVKNKDSKHTRKQGTSPDLEPCVVLLGDPFFMELPLEALSIFKGKGISCVCRDFSLQILYNRMHLAESETEVKTDAEISTKTQPKAHQEMNVKKAAVNRDLPSSCLSVDTHHFKYVVDPYSEGQDAEALSPSQKMKEILEKQQAQFTLQWEGVTGSARVPSQAEWEQLLTNCSGFLFYGMERFLCHVLLNRLVAMNIPKCRLMILLDLVRSKESYQRVANSGTCRSCLHVAVEGPTETAMLLSLTGVGSIIANQWFTTLQENAQRLGTLLESLLSMGRTTGQAVRLLQESLAAKGRDSITMEADSDSSPGCQAEDQTIHPCSALPVDHPSSLNCVLYGLPNAVLV